MVKCCECKKTAKWERITQFAGTHPFCKEHAEQEQDFGKDGGSSFFWSSIEKPNKVEPKKEKPKASLSTLPISPWSLIVNLFPNLKLTPEMAELLSDSTGMSKQFWLDIQETHSRKTLSPK